MVGIFGGVRYWTKTNLLRQKVISDCLDLRGLRVTAKGYEFSLG